MGEEELKKHTKKKDTVLKFNPSTIGEASLQRNCGAVLRIELLMWIGHLTIRALAPRQSETRLLEKPAYEPFFGGWMTFASHFISLFHKLYSKQLLGINKPIS